MQYDLVIFDMDGTILDTLEDLKESTNHALRTAQYPERSLEEIRSFVGNGIRKLIERSVPTGTPLSEVERVHQAFTAHYTAHCADHTHPYDGILPLLRHLQAAGCKTAVVSNKADYAVQALCQQYFEGLLDQAAGEQMPRYRKKPAPDLVNLILDALHVAPERAVYVGDSDVDLETAKNAGLACIAVDWGFRSREFLLAHGADTMVSSAQELEQQILGTPAAFSEKK